MSYRLSLVLLSLCVGACSDSATNPTPANGDALVGSWQYSSTNIFDLFGERLHTFFSGLQLSPEEADDAVNQTVQETRDSFNVYNPEEVLTFLDDGTWSSSIVGAGSWRVEGESLFLTGVGAGSTDVTYRYLIDGEQLTISLGRAHAIEVLSGSANLTDELLGLFAAIFEPDDLFVYSLTRLN